MYQRNNNSNPRLASALGGPYASSSRNILRSRGGSLQHLHQDLSMYNAHDYAPLGPQLVLQHAHAHAHVPAHAPYYLYPGLIPMTPAEFPFTPMLPSNLLATPSPYMGHATFLPLQPPLPRHNSHLSRAFPVYQPPHGYASPAMGSAPPFLRAHSLPVLPYLAQHASNHNSIEHLKLSRTVMLRFISKDVSLSDLLDAIDVGPIEYCKMFSVPCPAWLKPQDEVKSCSISFVNTQISLYFVQKYAKNHSNLRLLREKLHNSKHLQISLNESVGSNINNQDLIKVKTLNYIHEFNASRALLFAISKDDDAASQETLENNIRAKCSRFGEIEHLSLVPGDAEIEVTLHFTSIDSSIKAYEHIKKRLTPSIKEDKTEDLKFISVDFAQDRCDRLDIHSEHLQRKSAPTSHSVSSTSLANHSYVKKRLTRSRSHLSEMPDDSYAETVDSAHSSHSGGQRSSSSKGLASVSETLENYALQGIDGSTALDSFVRDDDLVSVSSSNSEGLLNSLHGDLNDPFTKSTSYLYLARLAASLSSLNYEGSNHHSSASGAGAPVVPFVQHPQLDPANAQNRTLFLGNLHPSTTVEEIANNVRAGGLVEWIKSYPGKRICFITFIDPAAALKFFMMHQVYHQLVIHGNEVCVKWGKNHSGPLNRDIALAVTAGASRNVYIGYRKGKDRSTGVVMPDEDELRRDFARFGEIEQVNFYHKKNCGFVNFLNIADAIELVDNFKSGDEGKITQRIGDSGDFFRKYSQFNISFGKDRCGNPLKFSFKKRDPQSVGEDPDSASGPAARSGSPDRLESIDQEAAMVFGILTDAPSEETDGADDTKESIKTPKKAGKYERHYVTSDTDVFYSAQKFGPGHQKFKPLDSGRVGAFENASQPERDEHEVSDLTVTDNDLDVLSDDEGSVLEDEDISIIIGTGSPKKHNPKKMYRHEKVFHNKLGYFDDIRDAPISSAIYGQFAPPIDHRHHHYPVQHAAYPPSERMMPGRSFSADFRPPSSHRSFSSGSQVMADYLAKSNQDQVLYSSLYSNPNHMHMDTHGERRRPTKRSSKAEPGH